MMVVNASFNAGLFYEKQVSGLCENTTYEFSADIINLIRARVSNHVKPNISFLIDGVEMIKTGDIPQTEAWIRVRLYLYHRPWANECATCPEKQCPRRKWERSCVG